MNVSKSDFTKTAADMLRKEKKYRSESTDIFWILPLKTDLTEITLYFSALWTKPPNNGSLSFLLLGASKDEGLALVLAAVNEATE